MYILRIHSSNQTVMARKRKARKIVPKLRSSERLVFAFHEKDSSTGVRRETVRRLASEMNLTETRFLHLGAALLVQKLTRENRLERSPATATKGETMDEARMSNEQIEAIRSTVPQDRIATTTFLDLLSEGD